MPAGAIANGTERTGLRPSPEMSPGPRMVQMPTANTADWPLARILTSARRRFQPPLDR